MHKLVKRIVLLPLAAAVVTACSSSSGGDAPQVIDFSQPYGNELRDCQLHFSPASAPPGAIVQLSGLQSANLIDPLLRMTATSGDQSVLYSATFLRPLDEDTASFAVPLNPNGEADGGPVELELSDGTARCLAVSFTIEPLPAAEPEVVSRLSAEVGNYVDALILLLGGDAETLRASELAEVADDMIELKIIQLMLDAPDQGLQQALSLEESNGSDYGERVITALGLVDGIAQDAQSLQDLTALLGPPLANGTDKSVRKVNGCSINIDPPRPSIDSVETLAAVMKFASGGQSRDHLLAAVNTGLSGSGTVAGAGALALTAPVAAAVESVLTIATTAGLSLQQANALVSDFLPSRWTSLRFDVETPIAEDKPLVPANRIDNVLGRVSSREHNLGRTASSGFITAAGIVNPIAGGLAFAFEGEVNALLDEVTADGICMPSQDYGEFDITAERWSKADIAGNAIVFDGFSPRFYKHKRVGTATITMQPREEVFGATIKRNREVSVEFNFVESDQPSKLNIPESDRGNIVRVTATMPEAHEPGNIKYRIEPEDAAEVVNAEQSGDFYLVDLRTPTKLDKYPFKLRLSPNGQRLPPDDVDRDEVINIDSKATIRIDPDQACIKRGESLDLSLISEGLPPNNDGIQWQISGPASLQNASDTGARIASNSQLGVVEVIATADADADITDTASFTIAASCLGKIVYPAAMLNVDGTGIRSNGGAGCPASSALDAESLTLPEFTVYEPPARPQDSEFWLDRESSLEGVFGNNSTRYVSQDGGCPSANVTGGARSTVRLFSEVENNAVGMEMDAALEGTCESPVEGRVECAGSGASGTLTGAYYVDISERTDYTLRANLVCENLAGYVLHLPFSAVVARFENGSQAFEPDENGTGVSDANGNPRNVELFSMSCDQAQDTLSVEYDFSLDAPRNPDATDLVIISFLGSTSTLITGIERDSFGPLGPEDFVKLPEPGSYSSYAKLNFKMELIER